MLALDVNVNVWARVCVSPSVCVSKLRLADEKDAHTRHFNHPSDAHHSVVSWAIYANRPLMIHDRCSQV